MTYLGTKFEVARPKGLGEDTFTRNVTVGGRTIFGMKLKVSKGAKIRNPYNQVPHLTQETKGKVTNS